MIVRLIERRIGVIDACEIAPRSWISMVQVAAKAILQRMPCSTSHHDLLCLSICPKTPLPNSNVSSGKLASRGKAGSTDRLTVPVRLPHLC